jgi:hypothetical protein
MIGSTAFPVSGYKGNKKIVTLEWKKLKGLLKGKKPNLKKEHNKLRGKIAFANYEILTGERLSSILKIAPLLAPEAGIISTWPRGKQFHTPPDIAELCGNTGLIMKLGTLKGKQGKQLGFLCLNTDAIGTYWFSCSKGFHNALTQSLASLENLIDEVDPSSGEAEVLNAVYRRLNRHFEEL